MQGGPKNSLSQEPRWTAAKLELLTSQYRSRRLFSFAEIW